MKRERVKKLCGVSVSLHRLMCSAVQVVTGDYHMKDIDLEELGELLDGELPDDESVHLNARVRVIGESATDLLFAYRGGASIKGRTGPTYEGNADEEYVFSGSGATFLFTPDETEYQSSKPAHPRSKGRDEKLRVYLDDPEDHRMIITDCDSVRY